MRLTTDQIQAIRDAASSTFGDKAAVWLFGSRVDDAKKGGDIDVLVRPAPTADDEPFARKIRMLVLLERSLGERKIDLVIEQVNDLSRLLKYWSAKPTSPRTRVKYCGTDFAIWKPDSFWGDFRLF
jgi:predicted nucleotidyltransferase